MVIKICKHCGREFEAKSANSTVCISCKTGDENSIFKCAYCGKPIRYGAKFCSYSCNSKNNIKNYQPFSDDAIINQIKQTNLEKYGVDNPFKAQEVINQIKQTKLEKYGNYNNIEKIKQTNLERYGVECNFLSTDDKLNGKQTKKEKYNDENYNNREKAAKTTLERYGVDNIFKDVSRIKQAKIETSGSLEKSYLKGKNNTIKTNNKKYGVDWYTQTDEFKERIKETHEKRIFSCGIYNKAQEKLPDELKELLYDREKSIKYLSANKHSITTLQMAFNCSESAIQHWIARLNLGDYLTFVPGSRYEEEINQYLTSIYKGDIVKHDKSILAGKELDFYIPYKNLGVEFNGTYFHSSLYKEKHYHEDKSKICEASKIRLIHIYEYEWLDEVKHNIILSILNSCFGVYDKIIYARNCDIKKLSNKEVKSFNNMNHLQGHRSAQHTYGLFYNNELVQIMSFSHNKTYEWEIIRECSKLNTKVIGGVSRLFKAFTKELNPKQVFSYCDFNKFTGLSYEKLGMEFIGYTGPDMKWIIDGEVFNRNPHKHSQLKELADAQIFGAGSKKFLLEV